MARVGLGSLWALALAVSVVSEVGAQVPPLDPGAPPGVVTGRPIAPPGAAPLGINPEVGPPVVLPPSPVPPIGGSAINTDAGPVPVAPRSAGAVRTGSAPAGPLPPTDDAQAVPSAPTLVRRGPPGVIYMPPGLPPVYAPGPGYGRLTVAPKRMICDPPAVSRGGGGMLGEANLTGGLILLSFFLLH